MHTVDRRAFLAGTALTLGALMRSDRLADLLTARPEPSELGYRQATVVEWDAQAGTNTLNIGGALIHDLPILGGLEATTIRPGDVIGVIRYRSQYFVLGRIAAPDLASNVTVQVESGLFIPLAQLAGGLRSASVTTAQSTSSTSFTDLATVGPTVEDVEIYTDRAVVTVSARMLPGPNNTAFMGFEVSGATSIAPAANSSVGAGAVSDSIDISASRTVLVTGLNPGLHTFTAKYESINAVNAFFSNRVLTVQPY